MPDTYTLKFGAVCFACGILYCVLPVCFGALRAIYRREKERKGRR